MPGFYDQFGAPDAFDAPEPATLQWPWSQPPAPIDPAAVVQPPIDVAPQQPIAAMPAPVSPDPSMLALPDVPPGAAPGAAPGFAPPELAPAAPPLPDLGPLAAPPIATQLPSVADAQTQDALNKKALTDQAGFSEDLVRAGQDKAAFIAQRRKELADADIAAAKQHAENWKAADAATQAKMDEVLADAQRIANTKEDPTGGVTGGRAIALAIGAAIGGLVQAKTGSARNAGTDVLNDTINRGIAAQRADLANQREGVNLKRNVLAQEFARHGDMFRAEETVRLASLQHADDILATEQQNYDPRGTTARLIATQRAQVAGAQATAFQALKQKNFENELKLQNAAREQQVADETARNNRQTIGLGYARLKSEDLNRQEARDARAAEKKATADAATEKNIRERSLGGEVTPVKDAQGNVVGRSLGPITKADGTVWVPTGTEQQVSKLQEQHANTVKLLGTLDEIRRIGPEWLSDTANTDKLQRLKQLMGSARLQSIAANNLGVPTGHDIELAEDFIGTSDPTRRKDSLAGLMSARDALLRNHNVELKAHGLDKDWTPPDVPSNAKQPQPGDAELEEAMRDPMRNLSITRIASEFGVDPAAVTGHDATRGQAFRDALDASGGMLPSIKSTLDAIATDLQDADLKKREAAASKLSKVSSSASAAAAARTYADQLLTNSIAPNLPQVQEQVR